MRTQLPQEAQWQLRNSQQVSRHQDRQGPEELRLLRAIAVEFKSGSPYHVTSSTSKNLYQNEVRSQNAPGGKLFFLIEPFSGLPMIKRSAIAVLGLLLALLPCSVHAASISSTHKTHPKSRKISESASAQHKMSRMRHSSRTVASRNRSTHRVAASTRSTHYVAGRHHRYYERFTASSFANDQVEGDITAGEDPVVRAAAVEALGNMNGTIVAIDPDSGRILAMVNQKLALSAGAQPCSTTKVAVALAALSENIITPDTQVPLGKYLEGGPDHGAGQVEQCLLRGGGTQAGLREAQLLRAAVRTGRAGGLEHSRRAPGHLSHRPSWTPSWAAWARCAPSARAFR